MAQRIQGTPPRKFDRHDGREVGKLTAVAAVSMVISWGIGRFFPDVPLEVQEAIAVIIFAAASFGLRWMSDTRHRTLE